MRCDLIPGQPSGGQNGIAIAVTAKPARDCTSRGTARFARVQPDCTGGFFGLRPLNDNNGPRPRTRTRTRPRTSPPDARIARTHPAPLALAAIGRNRAIVAAEHAAAPPGAVRAGARDVVADPLRAVRIRPAAAAEERPPAPVEGASAVDMDLGARRGGASVAVHTRVLQPGRPAAARYLRCRSGRAHRRARLPRPCGHGQSEHAHQDTRDAEARSHAAVSHGRPLEAHRTPCAGIRSSTAKTLTGASRPFTA